MDLSVREVARLLVVDEESVRRWARRGQLPAQRWDDQVRFDRVALQESARALGRPLPPDLFRSGTEALPRLSRALERGGIVHGVGGESREAVLEAVCRQPGLPGDVDRGQLLQLLLARERLASTAVGEGIAVPHPRDPLVVRVAEPVALLCLLARPVDFKAPDGEPVHAVFTLLSPTVRCHLQLLSALTFALHDAPLRGLLRAQAGAGELLGRLRTLEAAKELRP